MTLLAREMLDRIDKLRNVADEIGATLPQLALALAAPNFERSKSSAGRLRDSFLMFAEGQ